jgi:hypothetical protein
MTRDMLPYYNTTTYGNGLEGVVNYANLSVSNFLIPAFLVVMYGISIYVFSRSNYNLGGGIFFISFVFFLMSIIAQIFTLFSQLFVFIFFVGMLIGIILYFIQK